MTAMQWVGVLAIIALVVGLIGFIRTVWFISIGYAASIVAFSLIVLLSAPAGLATVSVAQLLATLTWGTRLGLFLLDRERKPAYRKAVEDQTGSSDSLGLHTKLGIWLSVSVLYVFMFSPAVFLAGADEDFDDGERLLSALGVVVMWLGLGIEATADYQKSRLKTREPGRFAHSGLYNWVRYPNYLGEILFWVGNFVAGLAAYALWWHWGMAATGLLCIILIMMGSTKRMELKHQKRYGEDSQYQEYSRRVPVLFPLIPLYTLRNVRVWLE